MEHEFENRYYSDRKMLAEFARRYRTGPRPWTLVITVPVLLPSCLLLLSPEVAAEVKGRTLLLMGLLVAVQFMPQWFAWLSLRSSRKQNDGVLPETVTVFGDDIQIFEGMIHLTIEYRKLTKTVRLKHSYLLMTGKRTAVMLRDDSFTRGSFEGFKQFLREKRPDLTVVE